MKFIKLVSILFLTFKSFVIFGQEYKVPKIKLHDKRIERVLSDYIIEEQVDKSPGAVILQYKKEELEVFYIGYVVYKEVLELSPPSFYMIFNNKLVLVYTGIEEYLTFNNLSFKKLLKDADSIYAFDVGMIIEPVFWKIHLNDSGYTKNIVKGLNYGQF